MARSMMSRTHRAGRLARRKANGRMPVGMSDARFERAVHHLPLPACFAGMQCRENATHARMPAVMSVTGAPAFMGGKRARFPVILINPLMPGNEVESAAIRVWPVRPKPEIQQ